MPIDESAVQSHAQAQAIKDLVHDIFSPDGHLQSTLLRNRLEQFKMAVKTAENLLNDEPLLFEAGTGVGKSLAYLIPGILCAMMDNRTSCCCDSHNRTTRANSKQRYKNMQRFV